MVTMFVKLANKTCMIIIMLMVMIITIIIIISIVWTPQPPPILTLRKDGRAKGCHEVKKQYEMKMRS